MGALGSNDNVCIHYKQFAFINNQLLRVEKCSKCKDLTLTTSGQDRNVLTRPWTFGGM